MGNNNRWAREGGVVDEILVENMWRNPEGNPVLFDAIVLEAVKRETNITLLLNTAIHDLDMNGTDTIARVRGYNSQNQTAYSIEAPLFVDASGDGIIGFLSGAEFRMGAESSSEFGEAMAPPQREHKLLGHSLYFYSRDTGKPVKYIPPAFALTDITRIPRYRDFRVSDTGCRLWWLEYGGDLDTVGETEEIKWELWSVAYGVWNYIKNSGEFPDAENLTLEWMGMIPGKRESRRFVGDLTLTQTHIVEQSHFDDAVSFGGWAIDLHPSDGVFSSQAACAQWHSKGVYQIPYRALYSRNIRNLFLSGRLISATHIAFGSTRVMATCASNGQAVGMAATLCREENLVPRDLLEPSRMHRLQQHLLYEGQHIPGFAYVGEHDLARTANITASSSLRLHELLSSGELAATERPFALVVPLEEGRVPTFTLYVNATRETTLHTELWAPSRPGNTTPDICLVSLDLPVANGRQVPVTLDFNLTIHDPAHFFIIVPPIKDGALYLSKMQVPGLLTLSQKMNTAVAKSLIQSPPIGSGIETFAFWLPERRPYARNLAVTIDPPLQIFRPELVANGYMRPWRGVNAWVPASNDNQPWLQLEWPERQLIHEIMITFDTDFDHPMESVLLSHPERIMPGCITAFSITDDAGRKLTHVTENHQTLYRLRFEEPRSTRSLKIDLLGYGEAPPALFRVSCR
jgi:hypothetical protein